MNRIILTCFVLFLINNSYPQNFRFAVWGDSQFQNPEIFEETVKRTELLHPDFVIHVGDMIHGYSYNIDNARKQWERFKKQISPLTVPFYPTPGNHDITTKEIQPAYIETWGSKLNYSFDYGNSHFIILNTGVDQVFETLPEWEIDWLKKDLELAKSKTNIFISMHAPLFLNEKYNWEPIHDLFKRYNVKAVFSGHYHVYSYKKVDGIDYFCLNSSGNMDIYNEYAGRFHQFLWITVHNDQVKYAVVTPGNIHNPDFIDSRSAPLYSRIFEPDGTIVINNPSNGIDTSLVIRIQNNSPYERTFNLHSESENYSWQVEPLGYLKIVEPGQRDSVVFHVIHPAGNFSPNLLPSLKINSRMTDSTGKILQHSYDLKFFVPPSAYAIQTTDTINLDGRDNEIFWQTTLPVSDFFTDKNFTPAAKKTTVRISYNNKYLYVFVKGEEPDPEKLSASAYGEIPLVFADDDYELYLDPDRDLNTFYRLMVNPAGTVLSSGPEGRFSFHFDVKTNTGKDFWSAEFRIPLKEIKVFNNPEGQTWGFNIRRHRQQDSSPQSDWSKMNNMPPYQPEYFGLLHFQ